MTDVHRFYGDVTQKFVRILCKREVIAKICQRILYVSPHVTLSEYTQYINRSAQQQTNRITTTETTVSPEFRTKCADDTNKQMTVRQNERS